MLAYEPSPGGHEDLGLVAKALLVAVRLHALSALMLADFGLTAFFQASHGIRYLVGSVRFSRLLESGRLEDDFREWILDDALGAV